MDDILNELGYEWENIWHKTHPARKLIVSQIEFNNQLILKGNIMSIALTQLEKVTATISPIDQNGNPLPDSALTGFAAVVADTTIATVANLDVVNLKVDILGVAAGSTTITYSGVNSAGKTVSLQDTITINEQLVATTLQVIYSTPVAQ